METCETCLEYFRRRLAEGWKCISLEGYNAVLLSPEGFRRELDLRNDVETLRPNGGGTTTENKYKKVDEAEKDADANENWKTVDDIEANDNDYVISATIDAYTLDLYQLPNTGVGVGTISKVTVYNRWYPYTYKTAYAYAKTAIRTHGTNYYGDEHAVDYRGPAHLWQVIHTEYALNPNTGLAWTWAEINALEAGDDLKREGMSVAYCSQVYVEVDYTYTPPTPPVTTEYQKRETARIGTEAEATLRAIISRVTEFAADSGTATGGSQTTCVDTAKNWETDMWKGAVIEIYSVADDIYYLRTISGNAATTITHAALPAGKAVASGDSYAIRLTIGLVDLDKWGGTALTGRDVSLDLKALTDISITGILKSIGDIAAAESLIARIGAIADAVVDAGATGSVSAKLRRLTSDLGGILTNIDVALSTIAAQSTLVKIIPIAKAAVFNTALPAAEADILGADITPTNSPSYLRIYVCVAAAGIFRVAREVGGVTIDENLNGGTALIADAAYMFTVPWRTGDAINFEYSVTGANILRLLVDEIGGAE